MDIKPIETYYNGYRFRSRLEARWAVFFDEARIRYQYEPEGFEVKIGESEVIRYLPDFYLPDLRVYAEVKPSAQKLLEDEAKLAWMIDYGGPMADGLLILGQIPNDQKDGKGIWKTVPVFMLLSWYKGIVTSFVTFVYGRLSWMKSEYVWDVSVSAPTLSYYVNGVLDPPRVLSKGFDDLYSYTPSLNSFGLNTNQIPYMAYDAARQARFEHGEAPRG